MVIWVGSSELVDTIIDDGSTVDLVVYTFTVDIYKSSSYTSISYGYVHKFIYKHTRMYHVIFLWSTTYLYLLLIALICNEMLNFFFSQIKKLSLKL